MADSNLKQTTTAIKPHLSLNPIIWHYGQVGSALDVAACLAWQNKLAFWDSVLAKTQTAGRGQMRRTWLSPKGNIYAALRLPDLPPFNQDHAALALGALLAKTLTQLKLDLKVKWPNDLVLIQDKIAYKVGGILVEERGGVILAGIGLNYAWAPKKEELSKDALIPAISLSCVNQLAGTKNAREFWHNLVRSLISTYKEEQNFAENWSKIFDDYLIFKKENVCVVDGEKTFQGRIVGICTDGSLHLLTQEGDVFLRSGSIRQMLAFKNEP